MKKIRLNKMGISCGIISLGEQSPETMSQGNVVYINQDHPIYRQLYKKHDLLSLHFTAFDDAGNSSNEKTQNHCAGGV